MTDRPARALRALFFAAVAALTLLASAPAQAASAGADIERVSFHPRSDGNGYVVRVHTSARVSAFSVDQEGGTVELVVYQARLAPSLRRERARGPVRDYRFEADEDRVTITFEVRGVEAQVYPDRDSDDLLVALSRPTRTATPAPGAKEPRVPAVPVNIAAPSTNWRLDKIVVDAGHGGHDVGTNHNGVREKDVTLAVSRRLGRMIESELGVEVVYTRSDDRFIELHERGRIANRSNGKLFISIHANAAGSGRARGTETFFLAPHRSNSARGVMERENAVVRMESQPDLYADFDDEGGILRSMAMSAYQEESQLLASLIEGEFGQTRHSRGVKQAGFLVLWRASMPAVLVETGFVTHRDEARYLSSAEGQDEIARSVFRAVSAYKERYERGLRLAVAG